MSLSPNPVYLDEVKHDAQRVQVSDIECIQYLDLTNQKGPFLQDSP